jgi:hypothetical protein
MQTILSTRQLITIIKSVQYDGHFRTFSKKNNLVLELLSTSNDVYNKKLYSETYKKYKLSLKNKSMFIDYHHRQIVGYAKIISFRRKMARIIIALWLFVLTCLNFDGLIAAGTNPPAQWVPIQEWCDKCTAKNLKCKDICSDAQFQKGESIRSSESQKRVRLKLRLIEWLWL